ncbi:hypothetical protein LY76DRAFT_523795 [Colletotrichum caudatum]|nr:hypothetical protein LY76DRAFT_523795 [Colletotrichum caudatum]
MKFQASTAALAALFALAAAEVPQEHSHEKYLRAVNALLKQDNPLNIQDAVFGLLGNAAAADGAGDVKNLDCLHQATADSAFSTAKAAGDVDGMASALVFAALERNTGKVGLKSVLCTDKADNPEIAALSQHQDPASDGAAEENKAITLELARQLASVGADPQLALDSGTFKPGDVNDNTGAGNTCDDADDAEGCIFSQKLLVEDASADEIKAAVADVSGNAGNANNAAENAANSTCAAASSSSRRRRARRSPGLGGSGGSGGHRMRITARQALDFGSCRDPSIEFGAGLDGRKEESFAPAGDFEHGSALNINVISGFICGQLQSRCKADAAAVSACEEGQAAAQGQKGQAAADAFNSALGV